MFNNFKINSILTLSSCWIVYLVLAAFPHPRASELAAAVIVDATRPGHPINGLLWGSNVLDQAPAELTVDNPHFVDASRAMGLQIIRWPGGNNADTYDWKRNEVIQPGRRIPLKNGVPLPKIVEFCRQIGAELSITINFGTMTPQDAADLVEFCNGLETSRWGSLRASLGYAEPLNVRFFEVGNEENQPHMWYYAWTAENPMKYFFGGDEERRGNYPGSIHDRVGKKGDFFKADGGANQIYTLRFPPVKNIRVFWAASKSDARNTVYEEWHQVEDLGQQAATAKVFELDGLAGTLRFGDGFHGSMPPQGSYFLVEYTTYGHKGFLDFARAMRQVPSSVPIKIGAATVPFVNGQPLDVPEESLIEIFEQMDFRISHRYNAAFPYNTYARRRQMAYERTQGVVQGRVQAFIDRLGMEKALGVGVTEWNIFLDPDYWHINRTLEGAVIAGEYFIRLLNAGLELPVWYAEQFALHGGSLSLYDTQSHFTIAPMGYVFEGFRPWKSAQGLPVEVDSPSELAYDQVLPFVQAAAAISTDGHALYVVISNSAERDAIPCHVSIAGFEFETGRIRRLEGPSITANNDRNPESVVLTDNPLSADDMASLLLQPHSVVFLELDGERATSTDQIEEPREGAD